MKSNSLKVFFTAVGSFLSSVLGVLYIPVLLMVASNVIDYITGLFAAPKRGDGSVRSYRSILGIVKKVMMWVLVVVGAIIDQLLKYASATLGIRLPFTFLVACIVAVWIVCNEIISILENIVDIGVELPAFLLPLVKNIKSQTENLTGKVEEESDYED